MTIPNLDSRIRSLVLATITSVFLAACGGGSGTDTSAPQSEPPPVPPPTTGTVGLLFTDKATEEFKEIKLNVVEAILIGGEDGQHVLFSGSEPIDLLLLENFSEPVVFGEVPADVFTKLRIYIDELELVPHEGDPIYPPLPANGKIDLLDPSGIPVLPGRTLLVELDMEANKAIKVTRAGNSMRVQVRPVVKANFYDGDVEGGLPDKLARIEGTLTEIYAGSHPSFRLCDIETPDSCIDVNTDQNTSVFDATGADATTGDLVETNELVVIGRYIYDSEADNGRIDPELVAFIIEIGRNAAQFKGNVVSAPANGEFLFVADDGTDYRVELQAGTKFFDVETGTEVDGTTIALGTDVEIEGVATAGPPDVIRAALVLITAEEDEQIGGTIAAGTLDTALRTFTLTLADSSTVSVCVNEDADILFVDTANSEVTMGTIEQLADDQAVELFGATGETCFEANEVIVDGAPPPPPP